MKFLINRSVALSVLSQALRTCNTKEKGFPDSEFLFTPSANTKQLEIKSISELAEQTLHLDLLSDIDKPEIFAVNGQTVVEFLKRFHEEEVLCAYNKSKSVFVMGSNTRKSQFAFPVGEPNDFIPLKYEAKGVEVETSGTDLATALKLTSFSASSNYEDTPYTAVKVSLSGSLITVQSTDKVRLSLYQSITTDIGDEELSFLLPKKIAEILSSLLEEVSVVSIIPGRNHIAFEWENTRFVSSLESGIGKEYPNFIPLFKAEEIAKVKISRGDFLNALKMAELCVKDSYINLSVTSDGLALQAQGDLSAGIDVLVVQEKFGSGEISISFNNLLKAVEVVRNPWLEILLIKNDKGIVSFVIVDGAYQHMIAPSTPKETE